MVYRMRNALAVPITLLLTACSAMSIEELRETTPAVTLTTEHSSEDFSACVVGAFNDNARGFEMIRFDGAKSYRRGNRTTISADTGIPMYFLDVTPRGDGAPGANVQERHAIPARDAGGYLQRFQGLTRSCLT